MKRLSLTVLILLLATACFAGFGMQIIDGSMPVSGGCSSACDPESNEVGDRGDIISYGTIAAGATQVILYTPDCAGYLTTAFVHNGNIGSFDGPVKVLVYEDDGDSVPDSGDLLIAKSGSITGGTADTWYSDDIIDACVQADTESNYWIAIAVDDDSASGWRYSYGGGPQTSYQDTTGNYYDTEPANLGSGSWSGSGDRRIKVYVTLD